MYVILSVFHINIFNECFILLFLLHISQPFHFSMFLFDPFLLFSQLHFFALFSLMCFFSSLPSQCMFLCPSVSYSLESYCFQSFRLSWRLHVINNYIASLNSDLRDPKSHSLMGSKIHWSHYIISTSPLLTTAEAHVIIHYEYTGAIAVYYAQWPASIKNACGPKIIARHVAIIASK